VSLFRALIPALALSLAFVLLVVWLEHSARPPLAPVTHIEARPAELPSDPRHWQDDQPNEWKAFELPLKVCKIRCTTPYTAWRYRFDFDPKSIADPAVYFPFTDANLALYLNGTLIEQRGRIAVPPSVYRFVGRLVRLPVALLHDGENELTWLLTIERRGGGGVTPFYIGDYAALEGPYRRLRWLTDDLVRASFWLQLTTLLFALALIVRGSRERVVLWFVLAAPFWLTLSLWHLAPDWIVSTALRFTAMYVSLFGIIAFSLLFVTAILEPPPRWLTRAALGYFAFGTLLAFGAGFWPGLDDYWRVALPHYTIKYSTLLILPYVVLRLYRYLDRERASPMAQWTLGAALLPAVCGLYDAIRGSFDLMEFALVPLAGLGISVAFCLELGRRVLANQQRMERYSEELAATVTARELELADNYAKLRSADRERALTSERQRIMQDMHDGVAGQLTALVYLANDANVGRSEIVEAVRAGLVDMRLVLDSLNQHDGDLALALGAFRGRIEALLRASDIRLEWDVGLHLDLTGFSPEAMLGVLRILQEAVSNAVRHARARALTVRANRVEQGFRFEVSDDGVGFSGAGESGRYGLSGMASRAAKLGARLSIDSSDAGTRVVLEVTAPGG
jgi:signal transduction histidine kinase